MYLLAPTAHLILSFSCIREISPNFCSVESFLFKRSPDIFVLYETNLNSIVTNEFTVSCYLHPCLKDSSIPSIYGVGIYTRENLPIERELSLRSSDDFFICFRISLLPSVSYQFFFYRSPSSQDLDIISDSIEIVFFLYIYLRIFVFSDFNAH